MTTPTCVRCGIDHPAGSPACPAYRPSVPSQAAKAFAPTMMASADSLPGGGDTVSPFGPTVASGIGRSGPPSTPFVAGSGPIAPMHLSPPSPPSRPVAATMPMQATPDSPPRAPLRGSSAPPPSAPSMPSAFATPLPSSGFGAAPSYGPPSYAQRTPHPAPMMPMVPAHAYPPPPAARGGTWPVIVAGVVGFVFLSCVASGVAVWRMSRRSSTTEATAPVATVPVAASLGGPPAGLGGPVDESQSRIPVGDSPVRGSNDALVTIVEVADFQCPFSRRVQESLDRLRAAYPTDVRVVYKHYPMSHHTRAVAAAELALEAQAQQGPEGFWRAHDMLFARQLAFEPLDLEGHAIGLGLDITRYRAAVSYGTHRGRVERDRTQMSILDVSSTPTLFVNGRRITGAQPYDEIQRVVAEELNRARATLAGGVPRGKLYGVLSATVTPVDRSRTRSGFDLGGLAGGLGLDRNADEDANRVYNIPVPPTSPWRGDPNAPVVIQMYGDFECPFTRRAVDTVMRVEQEYRGRVRVVWRNQPLAYHANAAAAANAANDVWQQRGPEAFWRYHALLFENQRSLSTEMIVALAVQVPGVDVARVRNAVMTQSHRVSIATDTDSLVLAGVRAATPIFFVNGRMIRGAQPIERFRAAVDAALGR